jgi:hypothetical protein
LADRVLLKIVCLLMRWLFSLTVLVVRGDRAKNAELLVLRRENAVLRRNPRRVRYEPADRAWFAALTRSISRSRWTEVFPVTPATLLAWHRGLATRKYDTRSKPESYFRAAQPHRPEHPDREVAPFTPAQARRQAMVLRARHEASAQHLTM